MKKFLRSPGFQRFLAWLLARIVSMVGSTQRWRVLGRENLYLTATDEKFIAVFWHETLPSIPILLRQAHAHGMTKPCVALASRHRDGQLIGNIMVNLGMEQVAGSTSKGGAAGLRGLILALNGGKNVALTPDGPRGPARIAAPGVAQLAALTGVRVLPCAAYTSRGFHLKSWDAMRVPLPFGHGTLAVGAPITVPRDDWQAGLAEINAALNAVLEQASR